MSDIPLGVLLGALIFLVCISAFFSAAEIAMISLNRHRLQHLANSGRRGPRLARQLLARPDRLIGVILLGSNTVNALFSVLTSLTVVRLLGEDNLAIAIATLTIALVVLILTDLAPKTFAALHPERIAFPSAFVLRPMLWIGYPLVWIINAIANGLLRLLGVRVGTRRVEQVGPDELKAIIMEAGMLIPESHQDMLLAILDLEKITVEDVMVPRNRIVGINLDADWNEIVTSLSTSSYTRMPAYRGSLDNVAGVIHARRVLKLMHAGKLDRESLQTEILDSYFIPVGTSLTTQLLNFKQARRRMGLVVDEYGDLQGLVTLDEILEEIVGDFTTRALGRVAQDVLTEEDGSYLVRGSMSLRDLNRRLHWDLPTDESRTLNGLILEYLEDIPEPGTSLQLNGFNIEIVRTRGAAVDIARIRPTTVSTSEDGTQPSQPSATSK
ncbi:MAG: magnesium/cobalt efflux protein [Candidatus Muproteobacteria bacterium RBG_16_60_9]|uniref:Magnesium/cobalt efflux protein n=1 Tax=Candidatus Muproteobacteria bacterium RBG_16_60_9 TaxID=1817755 RepID=A0A1F6VEH3_9PROT|nr:MAG: magnesium/cobalt efflux protein [Candidatus Muproteobacteria bacterium RBG_16_60_9]